MAQNSWCQSLIAERVFGTDGAAASAKTVRRRQTTRALKSTPLGSRCVPRGWLGRLRGPLVDGTSGTSAIEFALAAPLLLGLLIPVADLGLAYAQQIQVQQAVQSGAQYASLHPWNSNSITEIANAVTSATTLSGLAASPAPWQTCGCPNGSTVAAATCNSLCADGENAGYYVIVNARSAYSPILPYSLLGHSVTLTAQATVRDK